MNLWVLSTQDHGSTTFCAFTSCAWSTGGICFGILENKKKKKKKAGSLGCTFVSFLSYLDFELRQGPVIDGPSGEGPLSRQARARL